MDDDDFGALYGEEAETVAAPKITTNEVIADDDALFEQLYGDQEDTTDVPAIENAPPQQGIPRTVAGQAGSEEEGSEDDSDEDDLMITLDENATAFEPQPNKFQYQRQGVKGQTQAQPDYETQPAPQGLAAHAGRGSAIGGIPRAAIPGLGIAMGTTIPLHHPTSSTVPDAGSIPGLSHPSTTSEQVQRQPPSHLDKRDAVFPSQAKPGQPVKLPGQTRVSPEEYKEFLALGHGDIFDIDTYMVVDAPWRIPGIDPNDFFNYGQTEATWKGYCDRVKQFRLEYTMQNKIQTIDTNRPRRQPTEIIMDGETADVQNQQEEMDPAEQAYEAFVTSERPARQVWQRHSSPWEHTIVLTGHELLFNEDGRMKNLPLPIAPQEPYRGGGGDAFGFQHRPFDNGGRGLQPRSMYEDRRPFMGGRGPPRPPFGEYRGPPRPPFIGGRGGPRPAPSYYRGPPRYDERALEERDRDYRDRPRDRDRDRDREVEKRSSRHRSRSPVRKRSSRRSRERSYSRSPTREKERRRKRSRSRSREKTRRADSSSHQRDSRRSHSSRH